MVKYTRLSIFSRLSKRISFSKGMMLICGIVSFIISSVSLISPYLYRILIDDVMTNGKTDLLFKVIGAMITVYIVKVLLTAIYTLISKRFSYEISLKTKNALMEKILGKDISSINKKTVGAENNAIEYDSKAVNGFLSNHIVGFSIYLITTFAYALLMIRINLILAIISLVLLPLTLFLSKIIGEKNNKVNKEIWGTDSRTKTHLFDTMQKWREIKTNTLENKFSKEYDEMLEPERRLNKRWMFYYALTDFYYVIKEEFVLNVLMYFIGGLFVIKGKITIGELLMFISYMKGMDSALDSIIRSKSDFIGQKAVFERLFKILDESYEKRKKKYPEKANLLLENVYFKYDSLDSYVLQDVSCGFEYGKKYLIIGKSGEGKSTLIKLLLGIVKEDQGKIVIGDDLISDIDRQSLLKNMGAVMQENIFFNLSIRENLALVKENCTEEDIVGALKNACLYEFVEGLPDKLDTVIGERGIKLSGGQKQRLAIARIMLHNPKIVILDEVTSAIDSVTESKIIRNLNTFFNGNTMIVISHKPVAELQHDVTYLVEDSQIKLKI